jgi:hypothetical protein
VPPTLLPVRTSWPAPYLRRPATSPWRRWRRRRLHYLFAHLRRVWSTSGDPTLILPQSVPGNCQPPGERSRCDDLEGPMATALLTFRPRIRTIMASNSQQDIFEALASPAPGSGPDFTVIPQWSAALGPRPTRRRTTSQRIKSRTTDRNWPRQQRSRPYWAGLLTALWYRSLTGGTAGRVGLQPRTRVAIRR